MRGLFELRSRLKLLTFFEWSHIRSPLTTPATTGDATMILYIAGFAALHGLFAARPAVTSLSAELNGQLITALYDYQPSINDTGTG